MGIDSVRIGVLVRKISVKSVSLLRRSVCEHPFLVGLLCFVLFLHKSCPSLLFLLIAASPVLVCTAVLLATLLSFGKLSLPEIEKEEDEVVVCEIDSLRAGNGENATIVERDLGFGLGEDVMEKTVELGFSVETEAGKVDNGFGAFVDNVLLVDDDSQEDRYEKEKDTGFGFEGVEETEDRFSLIGKGRDDDHVGEGIENRYCLISERTDDDHDGEGVENRYSLIGERSDEDHDGVYSDDESDGGESSSPDVSLTDIIPLLDELHPLFDEDAPHPAHISHGDDSDGTYDGIVESDEDSEEKEEVDDNGDDDDDDDEEEEEEALGKKGDSRTSPITWTEDDQKNVMELGTLEIERNQRLESLLARMKARKAIAMMKHKDLIDFDTDFLSNVPLIATRRRNPFDGRDDSSGDMGLPGSAPSRLFPRRNPFDIPHDSEEKLNLKGESFEEEFAGSQQKETTMLRRNESFSWGTSTLGGHRTKMQGIQRISYFVAESAKTRYVPDTESAVSAIDQDDTNLIDLSREIEIVPCSDHASDHDSQESQSSDDADSVHIEEIAQMDSNLDEVEIATTELQIQAEDAAILENVVSEHSSLEESELKQTTDDQQQKEPVYDSIPSPIETLLSFSSISSETASPPASEETTAQFTDKESEMSFENMAIDINNHSNEVTFAALSQSHEVDENVSNDHDDRKGGSIEVEIDYGNPNELPQLTWSNMDAEVHVVVNQSIDENNSVASYHQIPSDDPTRAEHVSAVHSPLSSSEAETIKESALDETETQQNLVQNQIYASITLENRLLEKIKNEDAYFEEKCPCVWKKKPTSDKSMVEPCSDNHHEFQEQTYNQTEIMDAEEGITDYVTMTVPEFHDSEDKVSPSLDSTIQKTSEYESSIRGEVLKNDDEDQVQALGPENSSSVPYQTHIPETSINMTEDDDIKEINEGLLSELDIVGDFHVEELESLPTEMIQEGNEDGAAEFEPLTNELSMADTNLELPAFQARSVEDIGMAFTQLNEGIDIEDAVLPNSFNEELDMENSEETISKFAVINVRSVDDIHVVLQEVFDPLDSEDESAEDRVSSTEDAIEETSREALVEHVDVLDEASDNSDFEIIDARSLEDIHVALMDVSDGNLGESAKTLESTDGLAVVEVGKVSFTEDLEVKPDFEETSTSVIEEIVDGLDKASDRSNFQVISARSVDAIYVDLKEVSDDNLGKSPEQLDSKDELAKIIVDEACSTDDLGSAELEPEEANTLPLDKPVDELDEPYENSNFQVTNARAVEEIYTDVNKVSDGILEKSPQPLDFTEGLEEVEIYKVSSVADLISARVEPYVGDTNMTCPDKYLDGLEETSDNSTFQVTDARYVEDIPVHLKEVSGSDEVEVDKVRSTNNLDLGKVEPNVEETSMVALGRPVDGLVEAYDSSGLKQKGEKVRSHQSSYSSSSSSSSSSSDSD